MVEETGENVQEPDQKTLFGIEILLLTAGQGRRNKRDVKIVGGS